MLSPSSASQLFDDVQAARTAVDAHPHHAQSWWALGRTLAAVWRMPEAEEALQRATALSPDTADAWSDLAYVHAIRGRLDASLSSSRHATRLRSDLSAPFRHRALALLLAGQTDAAAASIAEARRLEPEAADGRILAAAIWFRAGLRDGASDLIAHVLREHPDSAEALCTRAEMAFGTDPVAADADLDRVLALKPFFAPAHFARALLRRAQGRRDEALQSVVAAREHHPDAEDYLLLHVELLEEIGARQHATVLASEQLRRHPLSRRLRLRLAMLLLLEGEVEQALRHVPGVLPQSSPATAWCVLADTWHALGSPMERRRCLEEALAAGAAADAAVALAQTLLQIGDAAAALARVAPLPRTAASSVVEAEALARQGHLDAAIVVLSDAVGASPDDARCHMHLGICYREQRDVAAAEIHLRRAIELAPGESVTYEQLAILLSDQQRLDEALAMLQRAIEVAPNRPTPRFNLAVLLARQQRWAHAEHAFRELLAVMPLNVSVRGNLGRVLASQQRHEDAIDVFSSLIALVPRDPGPREGLIAALGSLRRNDEAAAAARAWVEEAPDAPAAIRMLALSLATVNDPEAESAAERLAALDPESPGTLDVRGVVAFALSRPREALAWFDKGLALAPRHAGIMVNRALALDDVEGVEAAERQLEDALTIEPESPVVQMNLAMVRLRLGRFDEGWRGYERRDSALRGPTTLVEVKQTRGARPDLSTASVLVRAEQGLGDTMQFMRYLRLLARDAGEVWFHVQDQIAWMAWGIAPNVRLCGYRDPVPAADYQVSLLSLPGYYDTQLQTIPGEVPYVTVDPGRVAAWRSRIGSHGFRVGIVWHTNPMHGNTRRWIPLAQLVPLGRLPGVRLIALQKLFGLDQLRTLPSDVQVETLGEHFDEGPDAFADAAAVMTHLDLVITIDTSMAHLAGALGRPVWTLLQRSSDWRWLTARADSPWYPTMRLFRQGQTADWSDVAAALEARLEAAVTGRAPAIWPADAPASVIGRRK
jgi:tetratricopeptide (TPR) repeat protein